MKKNHWIQVNKLKQYFNYNYRYEVAVEYTKGYDNYYNGLIEDDNMPNIRCQKWWDKNVPDQSKCDWEASSNPVFLVLAGIVCTDSKESMEIYNESLVKKTHS